MNSWTSEFASLSAVDWRVDGSGSGDFDLGLRARRSNGMSACAVAINVVRWERRCGTQRCWALLSLLLPLSHPLWRRFRALVRAAAASQHVNGLFAVVGLRKGSELGGANERGARK